MTDRYAVAGNPISHSLSPEIHARFAAQTGQNIVYERLLVPEGHFQQDAAAFFRDGGRGMNVTVPFKVDAYRFAQALSERARFAGAVNTLAIDKDRHIFGDNTDGIGLMRDIRDNLGWATQGQRILILGAGGAVRGILGPLLDSVPREIYIANRTLEKAEALIRVFHQAAQKTKLGTTSFTSLGRGYDLVIHATSAGLLSGGISLPENLLQTQGAAYDLFYSTDSTPFLRWAERCEIRKRADGLGMLVEQAAEAFTLWRGVRPATRPVIDELRTLAAGAG